MGAGRGAGRVLRAGAERSSGCGSGGEPEATFGAGGGKRRAGGL